MSNVQSARLVGYITSQTTVTGSNVFKDNTEQDKVTGGDLSVPDTVSPIP